MRTHERLNDNPSVFNYFIEGIKLHFPYLISVLIVVISSLVILAGIPPRMTKAECDILELKQKYNDQSTYILQINNKVDLINNNVVWIREILGKKYK
jgi:hypothetical protein